MDKKFTYQKVVTVVCMLVSLFAVIIHVGNYTTFTMPSILFYAWHLLIGLVLIFLYKPLGGSKELSPGMRTLCRVVDWVLIALTAVVSFYVIFNFETYTTTMQNNMMTKELYVFGIIITLLVLEAGAENAGETCCPLSPSWPLFTR